MRTIKKTISLEPYKSRMPGMINSYSNNLIETFNKTSLISNYGMFPCNIVYSDINVKKTVLSYPTLIARYHFIEDYVRLLNSEVCCQEKKYKTAVEYAKSHMDEMMESDLEYYRTLDKIYESYGGDNFKDFLFTKCFPRVEIPLQYRDDVKSDFLYYVDVQRWIHKLNKLESSSNSCDVCLFEQLGGNTENGLLKFLENYIADIENFNCNEICDVASDTNFAHISIPLLITSSIDDLGEFTAYEDQWEGGIEYLQESGETIIEFEDEIYYKKPKTPSFLYDELYNEFNFNNEGWENATQNYFNIGENLDTVTQYNEGYKEYRYNLFVKNDDGNITYSVKDGHVIFNPKASDMCYTYDIISNNDGEENLGYYYLYNSILCPAFKSDYIQYPVSGTSSYGKCFIVEDYPNPKMNMKICRIGNKIFYSQITDEGKHYFNFNGSLADVQNGVFVKPNMTDVFKVEDDVVSIQFDDSITHNFSKIPKYVVINNNNYFINDSDEICLLLREDNVSANTVTYNLIKNDTYFGSDLDELEIDNLNENSKGYRITNNKINIYSPYEVYDLTILSGETESQLPLFYDTKQVCDDLGQKLNGTWPFNDKNIKSNSILDLMFHIGNTNNITVLEETSDEKDPNIMWGNILSKIEFYYKDLNGDKFIIPKNSSGDTKDIDSGNTKVTETTFTLDNFKTSTDENYVYTNLINSYDYVTNNTFQKITDDNGKEVFLDGNLYCDVTYLMGAVLKLDSNNNVYKVVSGTNNIEYTDTLILKQEYSYYNVDAYNYFTVITWKVEHETKVIKLESYNNASTLVNTARFKTNIDLIPQSHDEKEYRENYDGLMATVNFREEYKYGSSSLPKIEKDVYIERGRSSSFEKHIRLMDINSLEAMEQYGNGYYKINDN